MSDSPDKIREVIGKVIAAEGGGDPIPDDRVIARYPSLKAELPGALQSLRDIRTAELQSRAAGAIDQPLQMYSDDELDAPIETDLPDLEDATGAEQMRGAIFGYELLEQIGHGGQAVVYRARRLSTGGLVAIKVLPGGFFATSRARSRFDREAKALVRINHPNVVPVLDKGRTSDGSQFIVMGYVQGMPVDRFLAGEKDCRRIAAVFARISTALEELHRCGIVHRDLKPSNVLVDRYGEPKVLDFGLARIQTLPGVTDTGQILGSLPWASPEQAAGRLDDVDERSDIYAIGVMLAHVLDGKPPYPTQGGPVETARHIISTPPRIGVGRHAGPLDRIALKCLEKKPAQRFATARELTEQLESVAAGVNPPVLPLRRTRLPLWLTAGAALLTLCGVAWRIQHPALDAGTEETSSSSQGINPVIELPAMTNSLQMRFVKIPAGRFTMGSPVQEPGHTYDEQQKLVLIDQPFFMAVTETTQGAYEKVMQVNPSDPKLKAPDLPVQRVSFADAEAFCRRLSQIEKRQYRLPTEQEWEYACRASDDSKMIAEESLGKFAWFDRDSGGTLHPAGKLQPNRWGLYDMLGGVAEWCLDTGDPSSGGADPNGAFGIIKGGAFDTPAIACRSAARKHAFRTLTGSDVGFRVVLVP